MVEMTAWFGIMVRYWDEASGAAVTRLLAMPVCNIATAETLFNALEEEIVKRAIPWRNVVGFASDSASVMVGKRNSVLSRLIHKQPKLFSMACVCHLAALGAAAGLKVLPLSLDQLLIDIFYHFKHSSKRWQEFSDVLSDFEDIAPVRVLKHCTTRWLSLERATARLITLWPALNAYFDREAETGNERVKKIAELLGKVETKLYAHFVSFALKPLNGFNTAFQSSAMKIGTMQADVRELLRSFLANFVKPEELATASDLTKVQYADPSKQLPDDEVGIGTQARLLLMENEDELEDTSAEHNFFRAVQQFYQETVKKIIAKFPFQDKTLADLQLLDPRVRLNLTQASVLQLFNRFFPGDGEAADDLVAEFLDYRAVPDDQLPQLDGSLDQFWHAVSKLKKPGNTSQLRFGTLSTLAKVLLVLPHANADPERLFSMVNKVETDQRGRLLPSTVENLLKAKINGQADAACYESGKIFTPALVCQAKSATRESLSEVSSAS